MRRWRDWRPIVFGLALVVGGARFVAAQPRPLPIAHVDGVGAGNISLQTSADYTHNAQYTLSGLDGNLWRVGLVRLDVGLSSIADLELSGGLRDYLQILATHPAPLSDELLLPNPASTSAFDDIIVGTKIRVHQADGGTPGLAVYVGTRLPNAKHPSGLGQDTMDFYTRAIVGESLGPLHATVNGGLGVLGDPMRSTRHVSSLLYGAELSAPVVSHLALVVGGDGRTGPNEPGLESRAIARLGFEWASEGPLFVNLSATRGMTPRDGRGGGAITIGYTFHAFNP
ncbi:MAG: hypothetical protein LBQ09_04545 [Acidobacteriaceae bacterium]|jgi:hypothetical protein|nr:hypothetical protein [Acidobacteriaceae bacterium]